MTWKPRGSDPDLHSVLVPGVPPWMRRPLQDWYARNIDHGMQTETLMIDFDMHTRSPSPISYFSHYSCLDLLKEMGEQVFFNFLDFIVYALTSDEDRYEEFHDPKAIEELEGVLHSCGSEWRVGHRDGNSGLERRVEGAVQEFADLVMSENSDASTLLEEAWHAAFGRTPDTEEAYEKAIKAVEQAAIPVVEPNNTAATLGTVLRAIRDQGNWTLELTDRNGKPFADLIPAMAGALWRGQRSRHGANGYRKPSSREAEAAVILALSLVHWFSGGDIERRTSESAT